MYYFIPRVPEKATLKAIREQNPQLHDVDIHPEDVAMLVEGEGIYCGAGCGRPTGAGAEGIWWDPEDGVYHADDIPDDVERMPFGPANGEDTPVDPSSAASTPNTGSGSQDTTTSKSTKSRKKKTPAKKPAAKASGSSTPKGKGKTASTSTESGSTSSIQPAIAFLEECYRTFLPLFDSYGDCGLAEVEDPIILIQTKGRKSALGWMGPRLWRGEDGEANEISVSAEYLGERSVEEVLGTLLHEMVHHANACWGIKDCSGAQYHNGRFKALCEHVGLAVEKYPGRGWASTAWTDERLAWVREHVDMDKGAEAFKMARVTQVRDKQPTRMKLWECECAKPIKIRSTKELDVTCNVCGCEFEKKD